MDFEENTVSSVLYCPICQKPNISLTDYHNHQMRYHTVQELANTVIGIQMQQTTAKSKSLKTDLCSDSCKNTNRKDSLSDGNNNKNVCNVGQIRKKADIKPRKDAEIRYKVHTVKDEVRATHDKASCSSNCSEFIVWERELNKRIEIDDNSFLSSIVTLCNDLKTMKHKRKKGRAATTKDNKSSETGQQPREMKKVTEINSKERNNGATSHASATITSSCNDQDLIGNYSIDNQVFITKTGGEECVGEKNADPLILFGTGTEKKALESEKHFWNSSAIMDSGSKFPSCNSEDDLSTLRIRSIQPNDINSLYENCLQNGSNDLHNKIEFLDYFS